MGETTGIEWTDHTWNPWHGCIKVSPGCKLCYMYAEKRRYGQEPAAVQRSKTKFREPLKWKEPGRVFTCSWSDFFIEEADAWRDEAWEIIRQTPHLEYQILTKRPERIAGRLPWGDGQPWANVIGMVSVENQPYADERIPLLLAANFARRGISYEPALGPVRFLDYLGPLVRWDSSGREIENRPGLDWVIVGGESGTGSRPFGVAWARSAVEQCRAACVPVFVKQLGPQPFLVAGDPGFLSSGNVVRFGVGGSGFVRIRLRHKKGADMAEWPADLRVREFPEVRHV